MEAVLVDCYGEDEERAALDVYCSDALQPPFVAIRRDPGKHRQLDTRRHAGLVLVSVFRLDGGS